MVLIFPFEENEASKIQSRLVVCSVFLLFSSSVLKYPLSWVMLPVATVMLLVPVDA